MKTISWTVSAVRMNGNKDKVELGESPRGGAMFEDGELIGFIGYDGIEFIDANDVFSVFEGDDECLKEDFICGDFGLENRYMERIIDEEWVIDSLKNVNDAQGVDHDVHPYNISCWEDTNTASAYVDIDDEAYKMKVWVRDGELTWDFSY